MSLITSHTGEQRPITLPAWLSGTIHGLRLRLMVGMYLSVRPSPNEIATSIQKYASHEFVIIPDAETFAKDTRLR